jgi:hypothetical protein
MPTVYHGIVRCVLGHGAVLESFSDRLNHFWTFGILLLLACLISWNHGYKTPISCWTPQGFTESMDQYVSEECWYQQYHYPFIQEPIPLPIRHESKPIRALYQWLPIILCFQALVFKLPYILMYTLHGYSGISFDKITNLTSGFKTNEREILAKQIARYIYNWCKQFSSLPWRVLSVLWFVVKLLYVVNIIIQIRAVNSFLMSGSPEIINVMSYGDIIRHNLFLNKTDMWIESPAFPRYTLCDFIWVWFVVVAIVTCISIIVWTLTTLIPLSRKR